MFGFDLINRVSLKMAISGILSAAVSGLRLASSQVAASADNIVNLNSPDFQAREIRSSTIVTRQSVETGHAPGGVRGVLRTRAGNGSVDIATELVTLSEAAIAYKASLEVIATSQDLSRELLDIKA